MSQLREIQEAIYENLVALNFEDYVKKNKKESKGFILTKELFNKADHKAFEIIIIFLIKCLKNSQILHQYRYCYPSVDKNQESEFRKITIEFLKSLEKVEQKLKFTPIYAHQPRGEAFCNYLLNLTNYVLTKVIEDKYGVKVDTSLNEFQLSQVIEEEQSKYTEKQKELNDLVNKIETEIEYFESRKETFEAQWDDVCFHYEKISNSIRVMVNDDLRANLNDSEFALNVREVVLDLNNMVNRKSDAINRLIQRIKPKLDMYSCSSDGESSLITPNNHIMNLKLYFKDPELGKFLSDSGLIDLNLLQHDLEQFTITYVNQITKWASSSECDIMASSLTLFRQDFNEMINNIREMLKKMEPKKKSFAELIKDKRRSLLLNPKVQERRKWFASKIPADFPKLNFFFGDSSQQSLGDSGHSDDLLYSPTTLSSPDVDARNYTNRVSTFNWSFHPMDITNFSYIAPSAPDKRILSPLREESSFRSSLSDHDSIINISNGSR